MTNQTTPTVKPAADESYISHSDGGTMFAGPDATNFFRAATLWSALGLYIATGICPTRGVTITKMLAIATSYTGKTYKRNKAGYTQARADVKTWMDAMKTALPQIDKRTTGT